MVVINVGVFVVGMNVVVCLVVCVGIVDGYRMFVIYDGFDGFVKG